MEQEMFNALMPYIVADLIKMISDEQKISNEEAIEKLYASKLYEMLEIEETKVWQYSTNMLYALFTQENKNGEIQFPNV